MCALVGFYVKYALCCLHVEATPRFHEFHITRAHWVGDMKLHVYTARYHAKGGA